MKQVFLCLCDFVRPCLRVCSGAQAKHVPEVFLSEAVNALNGWSQDMA